MDWIPLNLPRPVDGGRYDIKLRDGEVIENVVFWDYGCGFEPLELEETPPIAGRPVKYPVELVAAFRPACRQGE